MRVLVRMLATLLGLALAVAGALLALEVGWAWWRPANDPLLVPWRSWRSTVDGFTWSSDPVRWTAIGLAAAGLVLVLLGLAARRRDVRLHDPATEVRVVTSRRSLARIVGQRVRAEDNVTGAKVVATRRRVRVRAASRLAREGELGPRLTEVIQSTVDAIPLVRTPRVSVVVNSPRDRR